MTQLTPEVLPGGDSQEQRPTLDDVTQQCYDRLRDIVRGLGSVLVAYSGGVDSAVLLRVAVDELGDRAVGVIATSPAYDDGETTAALELAKTMGARVVTVATQELDDPRYAANGADRCYFCKSELFDHLEPLAQTLGLDHIVYGMSRDDRGDWRPGQRAARERGVRAPLEEAGMGKTEIRTLARFLGMPVWDKPAQACYSSRIPYGSPVTAEALAKIGRAERGLRALGFRQVRVRHHDTVARLELDPSEFSRILSEDVRHAVIEVVRKAGYAYVALDLQGYRTGALNEVLLRENRAER